MSLSQATSPEEAKRELKQQVFLAIQGKYDTRQTSQLIEDIDTLTNAIENNKSLIAKSMGVPKNLTGSDTLEIASFMNVGQSKAIRDLIADGALKVLSRQSGSEELDKAAAVSQAIMDQSYNIKAGESKLFLLVDSELKSQLDNIVVDKNGMPTHNTLVKKKPYLDFHGATKYTPITYYRHHITVITGGWSFKRWFYCDEQNISNWSETRLLGMLDYVNKFFADYKEDPMNTAK